MITGTCYDIFIAQRLSNLANNFLEIFDFAKNKLKYDRLKTKRKKQQVKRIQSLQNYLDCFNFVYFDTHSNQVCVKFNSSLFSFSLVET